MVLARVVGTSSPPGRTSACWGRSCWWCAPSIPQGKDEAGYVVAVDTVDAGVRDRVLIVTGSSARMASGLKDSPVDAAIVGVVDTVEVKD